MVAPQGNKNATKEGPGVQVNFYLSSEDTAAIKRFLTRQNEGREPTIQEVRKFAREQSKNGIWQAIKQDLPAIIV